LISVQKGSLFAKRWHSSSRTSCRDSAATWWKCKHQRNTTRSQWPRGLRRGSTGDRLLGLWVRMPPGAWKSVCYDSGVLSGRGTYDELIILPEESCRLWCVWVWSWSPDNEILDR
jgi:hypothetical protein